MATALIIGLTLLAIDMLAGLARFAVRPRYLGHSIRAFALAAGPLPRGQSKRIAVCNETLWKIGRAKTIPLPNVALSFFQEFHLVLRWRPRVALAALYWHMTRRRVRARNCLRKGLAELPFAYRLWAAMFEEASPTKAQIEEIAAGWETRPLFSVVLLVPQGHDRAWLKRALDSVRAQEYPGKEIVIAGSALPIDLGEDVRLVETGAVHAASEAQLLSAGARASSGSHIMPLTAGSTVARNALFRFAQALQEVPGAVAAYADHDLIDAEGIRRAPWFKPQWNLDQAIAQDFISPAMIFARNAAAGWEPSKTAGPAAFALTIDLVAARPHENGPTHMPFVAVHCAAHPDQQATRPQRMAALGPVCAATGAVLREGASGTIDAVWPLPDEPPMVSIVIPTRDKLELLEPCLRSVLDLTDYPRFEVLVVDNGSTEKAALQFLEEIDRHPSVRVIRDDRPYNFSALNNAAVFAAHGSVLCMLNNDTEVVAKGWLTAMVRQALRPGVGAVGAKLLYPDGTLQHAGVVIGMGKAAGHAHRKQEDCDPGYFLQAHIQRRATAVTAACLVVERRKFNLVGGLDEECLAVAFNDVDFCLKLDAAGLINIYEPAAVLRHYESKSRGSDMAPNRKAQFLAELNVLQQRWNTPTWIDAMHHPALDRTGEIYRLGFEDVTP